MNRLNLWYKYILKKDTLYKLQSSSVLTDPKLDKIIVNVNITNAISDPKQILPGITALELITNQKPQLYFSKKSIAAFKLKKNMVIGCKVTLRKKQLFDFLDLFIFLVLGKVNTFNGFQKTNLDAVNHINLGVKDLTVFLQINENSRHFTKKLGCNIMFFVKTKDNSVKNLMITGYQIPKKK